MLFNCRQKCYCYTLLRAQLVGIYNSSADFENTAFFTEGRRLAKPQVCLGRCDDNSRHCRKLGNVSAYCFKEVLFGLDFRLKGHEQQIWGDLPSVPQAVLPVMLVVWRQEASYQLLLQFRTGATRTHVLLAPVRRSSEVREK